MKQAFMIDRPKASGETVEQEMCTGKVQTFALYYTHDGEPLKWSASFPLPNLGDQIRITMNGIGPAVVVGFFYQEGFLGVMTQALTPPRWLVEQRKRDRLRSDFFTKPQWYQNGIGCEFGAEIAQL